MISVVFVDRAPMTRLASPRQSAGVLIYENQKRSRVGNYPPLHTTIGGWLAQGTEVVEGIRHILLD